MRLSKKFILCLCVFAVIGTFAQAQNYVITFQTDGTSGATIDGATSQTVASGGDCTTVTANAPTGYAFVNWGDGVTTSTSAEFRPTSVSQATTYTATFAQTYLLTFQTDGTSGSSITGSTTQTITSGNDASTVTAVAPNGYRFVDWGDGTTTTTNAALCPTNVTTTATYTAGFIQQFVITFQTDGTGGATLTGDTEQTVDSGANCTSVTANNPPSLFLFTHWTLSDDSTTSTNPIEPLAVATTETYTATYAEMTATPTPTPTAGITFTPTPTNTNTPTNTPTLTPTATPTGFIDVTIAINRKEFTDRYIATDTRTTTNSSSVSSTFAPLVPFYLEEVRTYIGPATLTTGTVTISVDSGSTATANLVLDTLNMNTALYDSWQPTNPMLFDYDGQINIGAVHDATTVTRKTEIIWSKP